ncbi:MAG TPA: adenylate cyclase regulatory domain-containing protein [Acidimicrobiia bacterium]|nr:adenylate cyclase regulatory domain-containing protein [Acidimicrobiia bacterium]
MDTGEYEARGLYDPAAPNAADRLALLEWLAEQGATVDQMFDAKKREHLTGLAGDLALRPGPRMTASQFAENLGLTVEDVQRLALTIGRPVEDVAEPVFTVDDVEGFRSFALGAAVFGEEAVLRFTRVMGASLARIADAAVALFMSDVETPLRGADAGELALAKANLDAVSALSALPSGMEVMLRVHMERAIEQNRRGRIEASSPVTVVIAIGFVDLVGFTPLSQQMPVNELGTVVDDFEGTAHDTVASHGGQVVKLIGDEVMFVTVDATSAAEIALELVERFGEEGRVTPRGGLAFGEVLTRGGDYYGPVVNLASRIAELAVPNEILVTDEVRARAERALALLQFDGAGRRMLKGFDDPVELFALRGG